MYMLILILRGFEALNSQVFSSLYAYLETVDKEWV